MRISGILDFTEPFKGGPLYVRSPFGNHEAREDVDSSSRKTVEIAQPSTLFVVLTSAICSNASLFHWNIYDITDYTKAE
jgi:hypothetical protein